MSICPYCRGSGVVAKGFHFPAHRCPDCRGGGKIVCPTCRAERDHYNDIHACAGCDIQVCSACGPDGYCKRCAEELAAQDARRQLPTDSTGVVIPRDDEPRIVGAYADGADVVWEG